MGRYKRYDRYKDSGVEWIGEIPGHWEIRGFKYSTNNIINGTTATQIEDGPIRVTRIETISEGSLNMSKVGFIQYFLGVEKYRLNRGDILFSHINSLKMVGNCAFIDTEKEIYCGMNLLKIQPSNVFPKWLFYLVKSYYFNQKVKSISKQAINQVSIPINRLKELPTPVPTIQEQKAIANFLDQKTNEIDDLITDKEKLIGLLKEYRQSIISEAVTKGLNPDVEMKDSGVEWIGEIPEHWEVKKHKYLFYKNKIIVGENERDYQILSLTNKGVIEKERDDASGKIPMKYADYYQIIEEKTLLLCLFDMDVTPRLVGYAKNTGIISPAYTNLVPAKRSVINPEFYFFWYLRMDDENIFVKLAKNVRNSINNEDFMMLNTIKPPKEEQDLIVSFLDQKTAEIDGLMEQTEKSIEKLKEYRQSLISEAVTGKIDVREAFH